MKTEGEQGRHDEGQLDTTQHAPTRAANCNNPANI